MGEIVCFLRGAIPEISLMSGEVIGLWLEIIEIKLFTPPTFNSLPNDKILILTKLKAFADDKFNAVLNHDFFL